MPMAGSGSVALPLPEDDAEWWAGDEPSEVSVATPATVGRLLALP